MKIHSHLKQVKYLVSSFNQLHTGGSAVLYNYMKVSTIEA